MVTSLGTFQSSVQKAVITALPLFSLGIYW